MGSRFGALVANTMSAVARVLGVAIYYLLRAIYRPRERMIALAGLAVIAALVVALVYAL
ncbi:hypothetical protein [Sphingomonas sp.]|jgi:hypothetical protein|uniref:hypothetical protein n=1 Tax=Sphingomonas sp. TaxID=28214 RepID=UPI002EDAE37E